MPETPDPFAFAGRIEAPHTASIEELTTRWRLLTAAYEQGDHSDTATDAFTDEIFDIVDRLGQTPSAGARDLLAKAEVIRQEVIDMCGGTPPDQVELLILSLLDDLARIVG